MRIDIKKFIFVGPRSEQASFFQKAQHVGIIEFVDKESKDSLTIPPEAEKYLAAIKILRGYPHLEQSPKQDLSIAEALAPQIVQEKARIEQLQEQERLILQEIARISPFGHFSLQDLHSLEKETGRKVRFYCAKHDKNLANHVHDPELIPVAQENGLDYFIAISHHPVEHPDAIEVSFNNSLSELQERLIEVQKGISNSEEELKTATAFDRLLHKALIHAINTSNLTRAHACAKETLDNQLFYVEGWVPENKQADLLDLANQSSVYVEEVIVEDNERIPTFLENSGLSRIGEDLIHIFDTPSTTDKDPSLWVLCFFSLFFAMIVGDAGYGFVFLALSIYMQWKIKDLKGLKKRIVNLITLLACSCIIWGFCTHSFFGIPISAVRQHSLLNWLAEKKAAYHLSHHDDVFQSWSEKYPAARQAATPQEFLTATSKDGNPFSSDALSKFSDNIAFELALFIGSVHVILGLLRYLMRNPANLGWIAFIIGAYLYIPIYLNATSLVNFVFGVDKKVAEDVGYQLLITGTSLALAILVIQNKLKGIPDALTVAIGIFADIMSYLRIYALGLAGSIVSSIINDLTQSLPFIIAIFIAIAAHSINIILGIMSGVIHGLRLNFLEWYHYSFEGGGRKFRPLELKKTD